MNKSYLTVDEISDKLDVNKETVRKWIRSGRLKATIYSRRNGSIISEEDYQKFISKNPTYKPKNSSETEKLMKELEAIKKKLKTVSDIKRRITIIEKKLKEVSY